MMTLLGDKHHLVDDLPYVIFSSTGIKAVASPSNIYTREALHPLRGTAAYCNDKTEQRLTNKPCEKPSGQFVGLIVMSH
jgi:hypothetical protein